MATIRYSIRQKKWMVSWRTQGMSFQHTCKSEEDAHIFIEVQETISRKERELFSRKQYKKKSITVKELFDQHFLLCSKSPLTIKQDLYHAKPILHFFGAKRLDSLSRKDFAAFCSEQKKAGKAQSTIHRRMALLRSITNWGVKEGFSTCPIAACSVPKGKNRRTPPPSISELKELLRVAAPHVRRVILLGVYTGARIGPSELFSLTWDDVDLAHGVISMPSANKGGRLEKRDLPIRKELLPLLAHWQRQDGECPYVINWAGKPIRKIAAAWKTALRKSGIRPIRPYDLRHAYATYSIRSGVDLKTSAEIMGHESVKMILEVYEHVDWPQKVQAIERLPDFFPSAQESLFKLAHEGHPGKRKIDEPSAKQRVRDAVPAFHDWKALAHLDMETQHDHPTDEDTCHESDSKTENSGRVGCHGKQAERKEQYPCQPVESYDLKQKVKYPYPFVAKPKCDAQKQHDRSQSGKNGAHKNLLSGASPRERPG